MEMIISIYCIALADKSGLFLTAAFFKKIRTEDRDIHK